MKPADLEFLQTVAHKVLAASHVAGTTAATMKQRGIDVERVAELLPGYGAAVTVGEFVFKKVEPDPETPGNFGLFVRTLRK